MRNTFWVCLCGFSQCELTKGGGWSVLSMGSFILWAVVPIWILKNNKGENRLRIIRFFSPIPASLIRHSSSSSSTSLSLQRALASVEPPLSRLSTSNRDCVTYRVSPAVETVSSTASPLPHLLCCSGLCPLKLWTGTSLFSLNSFFVRCSDPAWREVVNTKRIQSTVSWLPCLESMW